MEGEVVIATFTASYEAELAAGYLRERGFSARAESHFTVDMNPLLSPALGGVRLWVLASEAEAARAALDERPAAPGPTRGVGAGTEPPLDEDEARELATAAEDKKALRARNAAIIGFLLLPPLLHVWSISACFDLDAARLSSRGRLHRSVALGVDAVAIVLAIWVATLLM